MGKRTRTDSNDYDYECIARKFKKLERMLISARRKRSDQSAASTSSSSGSQSSSSSSSSSRSRSASPRTRNRQRSSQEQLFIEDVPNNEQESGETFAHAASARSMEGLSTHHHQSRAMESSAAPATSASALPLASDDAAPQTCVAQEVNNSLVTLPINEPPVDASVTVDLDEDLLKILGDDPSQVRVYGKEIRPDIAIRLEHIATNGLAKDTRKELLERYLPPANSVLIDAPTLNPEVKAAVHEHVFKRDKSIELRQKQLSSAISAIAESLTLLFTEQPKNTKLIQLLMDSCKILCDSQNAESVVRRNFILHNLKKEVKEELQTTKIDKLLFSQELAEKIKAVKAINKSGDDLKAIPSTSGLQSKKNNSNKVPPKNLNWRGPTQNYYRPKGAQRTKEPVQKSRRDNSSRTSSRPHQHRKRSTRR